MEQIMHLLAMQAPSRYISYIKTNNRWFPQKPRQQFAEMAWSKRERSAIVVGRKIAMTLAVIPNVYITRPSKYLAVLRRTLCAVPARWVNIWTPHRKRSINWINSRPYSFKVIMSVWPYLNDNVISFQFTNSIFVPQNYAFKIYFDSLITRNDVD